MSTSTVKLDNGVMLRHYDDEFNIFIDENRIVYAPVYDIETCKIEEYSMYEDIIGFVNRNYDYNPEVLLQVRELYLKNVEIID